jgi:DNA-binding NtrC family response regulator
MIDVLVVDDDVAVRDMLAEFCRSLGFSPLVAATAAEGRRMAADHAPEVVLLDLRLPGAEGGSLLEQFLADDPDVGIILLTGRADVQAALAMQRRGAIDFLEKPIDLEMLEASVLRASELVRLRRVAALLRKEHAPFVITPAVAHLADIASENADVPLLIQGERGTGKERFARLVHERSARARSPFLRIDHSLSGFGAVGDGTVFLPDVGELPLEKQVHLLEIMERRSLTRLIASSTQPLGDLVADARFHSDLFYRLQLVTVEIPPLRERIHELPLLIEQLEPAALVSAGALRAMERYSWPGNVRELQNTLWRAALLADGGPIEVRHLGLPRNVSGETDAPKSLAEVERKAIADALKATDGNKVRAAALLGIARSTLQEKLKLQ